MDRAKFFAVLRAARLFGATIPAGAVAGIERLLEAQAKYLPDMPADELAINLATSFHETGYTMQPIKERGSRAYFNKYEPGTKIGKRLGNTQKGDGYRFRGEGDVQNTGRRNARVATERLNELFGLGIDLVKNPDLRGDPLISALSLFIGNREGWWTGRKMADFLDGVDEDDDEDLREFIRSRAVVNGTDKAEKIGRHALVFESALRLAGYTAGATVAQPLTDRATVEVVQRRLFALGYTEVGGFDGRIGSMTRAALLAFRSDNGLPLTPTIDRQMLAALDVAQPRQLSPGRAEADDGTVRDKVPEARASWWSKVVAIVVGAPSALIAASDGVLDNIGGAREIIAPLKEWASDVPGWWWATGVAVAAFIIWRTSKGAETSAIEAFKTGARR